MKISKEQIKQIITEDLNNPDSALLAAIGSLTQKIDNLDVSIDYLAGAVTGESPVALGYAQSALGRFAKQVRPRERSSFNDPDRMNEIVDAIFEEMEMYRPKVYGPGELEMQSNEIEEDIKNILGPYIKHMLKREDPVQISQTIEDAVRNLLLKRGALDEDEKYVKSFYKSKEKRADHLIDKGVPEDIAYGVADKQMAKAGKKKKKK